jgi:hypothetical protein
MTANTQAAAAAEIHGAAINQTRRRCGLPALTASELTSEFAAVNLSQQRKAARPKSSSTGDADSMWSGIIAKLNATFPSRAPIAGCTSPSSVAVEGRTDAVIDWSSIASALNREAGLATPARSRAR